MAFEKKVIFLSSLTIFLSLLDVNIVLVSYPTMAEFFQVNISHLVQISMFFLLSLTVFLPIMGHLNDLIGLKKIMITGYIIYIISGLLCGLSSTLFSLTVFRGIQGIGSSMLSIASTACIILLIPARKRGEAFGILATAGSLGLILGAPLGGILTDWFGWQSIFFCVIPLALIGIYDAFSILPGDKKFKFSAVLSDFDFVGAVLIMLGLGALVFSLLAFIQHRGGTTVNLSLMLAGIISLVLFVKHERNSEIPLVDLTIIKSTTFNLILLANMAATVLLSINNFISPFFITRQLHFSAQNTGFTMIAFSAVYGTISPFVGKLSDRIAPAKLCFIGMLVALVACLFFLNGMDGLSATGMIFFLAGYGIAFAFFISPANKLAMGIATAKNAGSTTAFFRTTRQLSSLAGISIVGMVASLNGSSKAKMGFGKIFLTELIVIFVCMGFLALLFIKNRQEVQV